MNYTYETIKNTIQNENFPLAYILLEYFDQNIFDNAKRAGSTKIRLASKSIRSIELMKRVFNLSTQYQGVMAYHPNEAAFLTQNGFNDILMGYPYVENAHLETIAKLNRSNNSVVIMVDLKEHIDLAQKAAQKIGTTIPVCIDLDCSTNFNFLWFGVRRSSIYEPDKAFELAKYILQQPNLQLVGLMGYEAQIAGLGDYQTSKIKQFAIGLLKKRSIKDISKRRNEAVQKIESLGIKLKFVNAGGTGSLESSIQESCVTEVTVGSGLFSPGLFDHYKNFNHKPAAGFALEVTRNPKQGIYTCGGGGYIASGSIDPIKEPKPYLPENVKLMKDEGCGEVQTPIIYSGKLKLGDPILFRHAKAGEYCERFNQIYLIEDGKILKKINTYRGDGQCFM